MLIFWATTIGLALASGLYFLVDSLSSGLIGNATIVYCIVASIYAATVGYCLGSTTWRARLQRGTSKLLFLTASSVFSFLVLEMLVRVLSPPGPFHPALALRHSYRMKLTVDLPGVSPTGTFTTNRWGLRGDEPPANLQEYYTLVTVGGSTTQCLYLDDMKTWPRLLQEKLTRNHSRVWVGNGGLAGHSTRSHVVFMREAISKIKPDAVILLVGINDLCLSLNENARVRGNGMDIDPNLQKKRVDPVRRLLQAARHHSRLVQLALVWKQVLIKEVAVVNLHGGDSFSSRPLREPPPPLPADVKSVLPQMDEFRANVKQIIDLGRSNNVRVIFLTQPFRFDDAEEDWRQAPSYYWLNRGDVPSAGPGWSGAQHWLLLQEYNRNLLEVCRANHVECYDLAGAVPHGDTCFYDLVHFNDAGAEVVAGAVASFLEQSNAALDK